MMPFCRSYTIHILGKNSVVTSMHSRVVYSTFCSAIFMQNEAPLPSPKHFNYKYLLIRLTQCLGTTDWNLSRPPPIFRRVCKISKSGNAAISAFLYVCLSVCLNGSTETSWHFVMGRSPKICREEWNWWQQSKKKKKLHMETCVR